MKKSARGFTLVELLVVVAVIAILAVIGLTVFTGAQRNARDAKRRADIDAISKALEVGYNINTGQYPAVVGAMFSSGSIPVNPSPGGAAYTYPTAVGSTYAVCAVLEAGSTYCRTQQQ